MLNKRANILFDEKIWKTLVSLAKRKNASIGELVRQAIYEKYIDKDKEDRLEAVKNILSARKVHRGLNYKKLIKDGRNS